MPSLIPTSALSMAPSPWSRPYAIAADARLLASPNTRRPRESDTPSASSSSAATAPATKPSPQG